ncbi:hypothetical protein [Viridibacillus arvi]|uniref:hypothetical protein n=1 Tax=Viridibacillus arvi TaxID=263475 RepID=UPI0034CF09F2
MNIYRSNKKNDVFIFEVFKDEYQYWDAFCEFFIAKCVIVIEKPNLNEANSKKIRNVQETLEMLMFTLDVGREDLKTDVPIPTTFLSLFYSLMKKWDSVIQGELQQNLTKLQQATNGENKRKFSDETNMLTYLLKMNQEIKKQLESFNKSS